jgi:hypothetical protein
MEMYSTTMRLPNGIVAAKVFDALVALFGTVIVNTSRRGEWAGFSTSRTGEEY